jgi:hypothetical protein
MRGGPAMLLALLLSVPPLALQHLLSTPPAHPRTGA